MLCWSWQQTTDRFVSTLGKIHSSAHPSYTMILIPLITFITQIQRTFCTLETFITWIKFIPNCDIACLVYVKLKLIGKILTLLQQTLNSVSLYSHKLREHAFHSLSSPSSTILLYVCHFLNHTIVFSAAPLTERPRQRPGSPNGSAGTDLVLCYQFHSSIWIRIDDAYFEGEIYIL